MKETHRRKRISVVFLLYVFLVLCAISNGDDLKEADRNNEAIVENGGRKPQKLLSLGKSFKRTREKFRHERAEIMQSYWKSTFDEIRSLSLSSFPGRITSDNSSGRGSNKLFTQWKSFGANSESTREEEERARFDGFPSWDQRIQQWSDDVAEHIDKVQDEGGRGYPFSTYGQPAGILSSDTTILEPLPIVASTDISDTIGPTTDNIEATPTKKISSLPIPTTARLGDERIIPDTDLSDKTKNILIVTTASLPWMTGTAVNPLLRAAYMTKGRKDVGGSVTLMIPWLERQSDREEIYGKNMFDTREEQEEWVRDWLCNSAGMTAPSKDLKIRWYNAWFHYDENSVYSMGDITALIPEGEIDICVLEEPEHLNWYRAPGESWTDKFKHVVGIVHTNYFTYAQDQPAAYIRAPAMRLLTSWMCRAHCHRVIKLSGTLGQFAPEKELIENVHGVRGTFLDVGKEIGRKLESPVGSADPVFGPEADPTVYFIGKMLWSKGLSSLMELLKYAEESANLKIKVDMYGGGPDKEEAQAKAARLGLNMPFHGPIDHANLGETQKIFINPSTSEVLCTTVAEALAMGKFVIIPSHPSNDFFTAFPNCLTYATKEEFVGNLYYAATHSPEPLRKEYAYALSWDAAMERFEAAGCISEKEVVAMSQALSESEAGVMINLPPLVEDEESRDLIVSTLFKTRDRYRNFRSTLAEEIQQNDVLPKQLQARLVAELDKRLDLNIDEILDSPKLRLQLSPAELDKLLLEFYIDVTRGQLGDVMRLIGGGREVARQNLYMKRRAQQEKKQGRKDVNVKRRARHERKQERKLTNPTGSKEFVLSTQLGALEFDETLDPQQDSIATQLVKKAIKRNLPVPQKAIILQPQKKGREAPKMSLSFSRGIPCQQLLKGVQVPYARNTRFVPAPILRLSCVPLI